MRLTCRYRFAASHRLDSPALSPEENRKLYGKCNNPYGHGHNYALEVSVEGPVDADGQVVNREALDRLVKQYVLGVVDHKNLNQDVPAFDGGADHRESGGLGGANVDGALGSDRPAGPHPDFGDGAQYI